MSEDDGDQRVRAEVVKLARLLEREPEQLRYLERLPLEDLRALREQATEVLFSAHGAALGKLATASRLLPTGLVASLAERAFGPLLSALIAGLLEPSRAVDVAAKLNPAFLADVAVELDPRRASAVVSQMPPRQIAAVTSELTRRGEYVAMGRYVGHLSDEALSAAMQEMDDRTVSEVAFVLEEEAGRADMLRLLPPERRSCLEHPLP